MTVLTRSQVAQYAAQAGFKGNALTIALAVAQAESSFRTDAINHNTNGSTDYGLWQINSIHGYSSSQLMNPLYNAQAAYKISGSGSNWQPWTTYNTGAYLKYMPTGTDPANTSSPAVQTAKSNTYPRGQCTWWASERYHQLTNYYVPWAANAKDWSAQASKYGWKVSSTPTAPSILCLQAGIQGADGTYGHVGVVESLNSNGTVRASSQNWGLTAAARASTSYVNFKPGAGVSFISAGTSTAQGGNDGSPTPTSTGGNLGSDLANVFNSWAALFGGVYVAPAESVLQQVHATLIDHPGFYGIALALDEAEQFPGYQNLASGPFDVIGMIRSIGASIGDNFLPFAIRSGLVSLGLTIIFLLVAKVVLQVGEGALSEVGELLPLIAGA
jgi:surface antigen